MRISYLLFFLVISTQLWSSPQVKVLPEASLPQEFIHENLGCQENSECDPVMGHQLHQWQKLIKDPQLKGKEKRQALARHLKEKGLPIEFYTIQKVNRFFKPMLFNSHCRDHNPKEGEKTLRGTAFLKQLSPAKAIIWRDQAEIEFKPDEQLVAQPIKAYFDELPQNYLVGLDDQPLYLKDKKLYILKEYDEEFFLLEVSPDGQWQIVDMDLANINTFEDRKTHIDCPPSSSPMPKEFSVKFCKGIWDETSKKLIPVEMYQGCAN